MAWIILFTRTIPDIRELSSNIDGSVSFVSIMIILSCFAGMFIVLLLLLSDEMSGDMRALFIAATVAGMIFSWAMVHTIYAFHYAHIYYGNSKADEDKPAQGLEFPGDEKPDYLDFAYFAFVIGCTFQVSDVEISSKN